MFKLKKSDYPSLFERGSGQFIKKDDAIKLVKYCIDENYLIVMCEGFIITKNYTIPIMDMILDYNGIKDRKSTRLNSSHVD